MRRTRGSVAVSAEEYERLMRRDRRVVRPGDLSDELLDPIAKAEVLAE